MKKFSTKKILGGLALIAALSLAACLAFNNNNAANNKQDLPAASHNLTALSTAAWLDPIAAADVQLTDNSQIISMDLLRLTEHVTSAGIAAAQRNMEKTRQGLLPKREPLSVVNRGDGTYCIFDGNKTYSMLRELGAKNVPVVIRQEPYQKKVKTVDDLYAKCSEADAEFRDLVKSLSEELGAEYVIRSELKSRERAIEKANNVYSGDISMICDVLAASLIFNSEQEVYAAVEKLKLKDAFVSFYDRWHVHIQESGYRDFHTNVCLSNGAIAEIQLHAAAIFDFAHNGSHYIYEFTRIQKFNPEMAACVKQANKIQREIFDAAADGRYLRLSQSDKNLLFSLAKQLSVQNTPQGAEQVLNKIAMLADSNMKAQPRENYRLVIDKLHKLYLKLCEAMPKPVVIAPAPAN